tara:strand:+ start:39 stop:503 length:465 start_codon:yes stop_codon:yes gene_type:complete
MSETPEIPLGTPLEFSQGGSIETAHFIRIFPPSGKNTGEAGQLKQCFMRALKEQVEDNMTKGLSPEAQDEAEEAQAEQNLAEQGQGVCAMVSMSTTVDYPKFLEVGKRFLTMGGVALIGPTDIPLKSGTVEKLTLADLEAVVGGYVAHFISASA